MARHKDLTGTDLHEPKGVAAASSGQVYVANGSGSGAWATVAGSYATLTAVSQNLTDSDDACPRFVVPFAGTIDYIAITTDAASGGSGNTTLRYYVNGVEMTSAEMVIAAASTNDGAVFAVNPSDHNTVNQGDVIKVTSDGGMSGSQTRAYYTVRIHAS